ncbi:MAG: hypothetical protein ACM3N9_03090 [Syntrophothermus sp.]
MNTTDFLEIKSADNGQARSMADTGRSEEVKTVISPLKSTVTLLRVTFGVVPVVAGIDKFTDLLVFWDKYLPAMVTSYIPAHTFMMIVGIVEITAGIIVLARPKIGGLIVAAWLTLIGLSLLSSGHYLDVAVRDFVMAIGAFSLARLSGKNS